MSQSAAAKKYQKQHLPCLLDLKDYDDITDWIKNDGIVHITPKKAEPVSWTSTEIYRYL